MNPADPLREALAVGEQFLNKCNAAWAAGEPSHRVNDMLDAADKFRDALGALSATREEGGAAIEIAFDEWLKGYVGQQDAFAMRFSVAELEIAFGAGKAALAAPSDRRMSASEADLRAVLFKELRGSFFAGRGSKSRDQYDSEALEAAWEKQIESILAAIAALQPGPAASTGFVVVPVEPTEATLAAMCRADEAGTMRDVYAAALSTDPQASAPEQGVGDLREAEARIMQEYRWGNLTEVGVANHLRRAGFNSRVAYDKANALSAKQGAIPAGDDVRTRAEMIANHSHDHGSIAWCAAYDAAVIALETATLPSQPVAAALAQPTTISADDDKVLRDVFAAGFHAAERALGFEGCDESADALEIEWGEYLAAATAQTEAGDGA